jgi:hypothetical protein
LTCVCVGLIFVCWLKEQCSHRLDFDWIEEVFGVGRP